MTADRANARVWIKREECNRSVSFSKGNPPKWKFYEGLKKYGEEYWYRYACAYGSLPDYPRNDVTWDTHDNLIIHNSFEVYGNQPEY